MTVLQTTECTADVNRSDATDDTSDPSSDVGVEFDGATAIITVGRGVRRNALPATAWADLAAAVTHIASRTDAAVALVRGAGDTFCSGSDIREWWGASQETVEDAFATMETAFRAIEGCPIPVIAQIEGVAAGAGCQLALACDIRVMSADALIGMPIARLGINPSPAFAARMIRVAGPAVTARLLYTGRLMTGPDAVAAGLADVVVDGSELDDIVAELLADIVRQPGSAIRSAKAAIAAADIRPPVHSLGPVVNHAALQHGIGVVLGR